MLFFINLIFSQGEANIWYFGQNAGLDFNSGSPVVLSDGQMSAFEGCATISNATGELLFYTNGISVWNKNHNIMPNGTGLMADISTTQAAVIVPKPNSDTIYYIFTTSATANGANYSEVDISLNNGLGDVNSNKNIPILASTCEKLTVVKHSNETDFWVVFHGFGNNSFLAYQVSATGVNMIPVVSNVGAIIDDNGETLGSLKFSPDGTKLINCTNLINAELFDFNASTGVISNPRLVSNKIANYGVEFSPSGNIAYITTGDAYTLELIQYDLTATNIPSTAVQLHLTADDIYYQLGALQLAPDGKIYISFLNKHFINRINNPNILGLGCGFQLDAISLGTALAFGGLPQFIQPYFNVGFNFNSTCLGATTAFLPTNSAAITAATWDFGDGNTSTNINSTHTYTNPGTYTVSATFSNGTDTTTYTKEITIAEVPVIANNIPNQSICGAPNHAIDLAQYNSTVLSTQSPTTYGVAYFSSMADAVAHSNSLATNQLLSLGTTTFYVKIYNVNNTSCHAIDNFEVTLYAQPIANIPSPYFICETAPYDGMDTFYLTTKNSEILNGQSSANFSISYHPTLDDANANTSPLPFTYVNAIPSETLYTRIQNNNNANCFATLSLELKVIQEPAVIPVSDYKICDDATNDGFASFDLSTKTSEILNGQTSSVFDVHYYWTVLDAQNNTNEIVAPVTNASANQEIFYTIIANGNTACKAEGSFFLKVDSLPIAYSISDFFECDDVSNNGIENFNLSSKNSEILGNQNATNFSVSYFDTAIDAQNNSNPLPYSYTNISNPQTIFARIMNNQNQSCYAVENFQIGVNSMPVALDAMDMITCDDETNNGKELFDLNLQNASILGAQDPTAYTVTYHSLVSDANAGTNALAIPHENSSNPQTIYARVTNNVNSSCFSSSNFDLIVREKPMLNMKDVYSICEGFTVPIQAPSGYSSYVWSTGETTQNIIISEPGNFSVTVTKEYGDIICDNSHDFTVYNSNKATITSIEIKDWTQSENVITVMVSGDGEYEYSLNGIDFQHDNQFSGLILGNYIVYVRDKKGCGTVKQEVFLLSYPKYFTPNGDGYNDYWHINFSYVEPQMKVLIFDRYGKLITTLSGSSPGWNGTYNGNLLPATDYWFVIERENGKEYKGHFSLKR